MARVEHNARIPGGDKNRDASLRRHRLPVTPKAGPLPFFKRFAPVGMEVDTPGIKPFAKQIAHFTTAKLLGGFQNDGQRDAGFPESLLAFYKCGPQLVDLLFPAVIFVKWLNDMPVLQDVEVWERLSEPAPCPPSALCCTCMKNN